MSIHTMTGSAGNWTHGCAQAAGLWLTRGGLRVHSMSRVRVRVTAAGTAPHWRCSGLSSDRHRKDDY